MAMNGSLPAVPGILRGVFGFVPRQSCGASGSFVVPSEIRLHFLIFLTGISVVSFIPGSIGRLVGGKGDVVFHIFLPRVVGSPVGILDRGIQFFSDRFPCKTAHNRSGGQSDDGADRAGDGADGGTGYRTASCSNAGSQRMRSARSGDGITIGIGGFLLDCLFCILSVHFVISFLVELAFSFVFYYPTANQTTRWAMLSLWGITRIAGFRRIQIRLQFAVGCQP